VPIFLNYNFYTFNQNVLFHTSLGIVTNLVTNGIGIGGYTSSKRYDAASLSLKHNEIKSNNDLFIRCAVSFPKYSKGLQVFVLYSGIANLNGNYPMNVI